MAGFDFDPTVGQVAGSRWGHPPGIDDPEIGRSRSVVPIINRIDVDDTRAVGARMGVKAKRTNVNGHAGRKEPP